MHVVMWCVVEYEILIRCAVFSIIEQSKWRVCYNLYIVAISWDQFHFICMIRSLNMYLPVLFEPIQKMNAASLSMSPYCHATSTYITIDKHECVKQVGHDFKFAMSNHEHLAIGRYPTCEAVTMIMYSCHYCNQTVPIHWALNTRLGKGSNASCVFVWFIDEVVVKSNVGLSPATMSNKPCCV